MTKLYDLCVAVRSYKDNQGNNKAVWENIGTIIRKDDGKVFMTLKAHFNPAAIQRNEGSECIVVSMFPPKARQQDNSSQDFNPVSYDPNIPF